MNLDEAVGRRISLTATAHDAKAGAVVVTDDEHVVYVRGLRQWPAELRGTRVKIDGIVRRGAVYPQATTEEGMTSQGVEGEQLFLEDASYRPAS